MPMDLRQFRELMGFKLRYVARHTAINPGSLSRYERRLQVPNTKNLLKLSKFYGLEPTRILEMCEPIVEETTIAQ